MRILEFAAALVGALVVHFAGVRLFDDFSSAVDVFLVVALFNALGGNLVAGLTGGLAAGWLADAVSGGLYGLHGFADTVVGYGGALAAQRLVIQRPTSVFLLFALGAVVQQLILVGLSQILVPGSVEPQPLWLLVKFASAGALGAAGFVVWKRALRWRSAWRRNRTATLR